MTKTNNETVHSSFRDPSGFLFKRSGSLYRQINRTGQDDYDLFIGSGLYQQLVEKNLLVSHQEVNFPAPLPELAYKIIQPERIPFISYPYEWSFSQLKSAARATLQIQKLALEFGMVLKDSSAYNIQFLHGRAILIDTLSFERYQPGQAWTAYRQFCQHFLAPLALMAYRDIHLSNLLRVYLDGIPLELASNLLPKRTRFNPGLFVHIHLHANSIRKYSKDMVTRESVSGKMNKSALLGLVDSLLSVVKGLQVSTEGTDWADYYDQTNYTPAAFEDKKRIVAEYLKRTEAQTVWDLGANTGIFSRLATQAGMQTIAFDIDPAAVERNYRNCLKEKETRMLPLVMDLTNPSSGIGWHHHERLSLLDRGPADAVMALALLHHLVIGNNVPMLNAAQFLRACGNWLIIEFIPKEDTQIQKMLALRKDIFTDYDQQGFENAFRSEFEIIESCKVVETSRWVYLMRKRVD